MSRTIGELQQLQSLPLAVKIKKTEQRIREWVDRYGVDGVSVSFSGGKDSTVLMDIARKLYPDIPAVFVDVPTQYPELRGFVKTYENVDIVRPKLSFMQVCEKYGFPMISKEVSDKVYYAQKYLTRYRTEKARLTDRQTDRQTGAHAVKLLLGMPEMKGNIPDEYIDILMRCEGTGSWKIRELLGKTTDKNGKKSMFDYSKWAYLANAPFRLSCSCCAVMKKAPLHKHQRETGRNPITAQMASESRLRTQKWLQNGCNGFDLKTPISNPMSFWTEQDVLLYIYTHKLPICSVYGEVVKDAEVDGQYDFEDLGIFDLGTPTLKTTGCERTGCCLCGFGAHIKGDTRFLRLKETHPGIYGLLDKCKNNGYTLREAIEWINEHGNLDIKI